MTPINPAAAGGLPQYAEQGYAPYDMPVDPYEGMDPYALAEPDPYAAQYVDPYATQYVDPAMNQYVDPYAGQYVDPYAAAYTQPYQPTPQVAPQPVYSQPVYSQPAASIPVAGAQPALTSTAAPLPAAQPATVADFAALGIFDQTQLAALQASGMSPTDLGVLYDKLMQDPEVQQQLAAQQGQTGAAPTSAAAPAGPAAPAGDTKPAWNKEWQEEFRAAFKAQGLDSKTQMLVLSQLRSLKIGEAELAQALEYYANSPEGAAELKAVDQQVRASKGNQNKQFAALGALTLAAGAGTTMLARSQGNLVKSLTRAALTGTTAEVAAATRMLAHLEKTGVRTAATALQSLQVKGVPIAALGDVTEKALRAETAAVLRDRAGATNRLLHPGKKMVYNAGARHLTEATKLSGRDLVKYALWMKQGDNVPAASRAAVTGGGAAVDDAARAASSVSRGGATAAASTANAARSAGMLSKVGKFAGPIGLVASAGFGIWGIKKTMEAEGGFGEESKKMTGNVSGGLAGGMAGAAAGAALGSVVPVIGTGVGAVVGGLIGGFGGGAIGEKLGGLF